MKSTDHFKQTIKAYLDKRAGEDALFAASYAKPDKNIDNCITYILNTVQKSGCNGFADEEIYSMAVHFFDEDNIKVGKPINARVTVNHPVELTEEEKREARQAAISRHQEEMLAAMKKKTLKPAKEKEKENRKVEQASLFD